LRLTWISVVTWRRVTLSGPSPDSARATWAASPGPAEVVSARPIAEVPASQAAAISVTSAMACALAWQYPAIIPMGLTGILPGILPVAGYAQEPHHSRRTGDDRY
jgi:hypothetical protein